MKHSEIFHAWGRILTGRAPSMSIEITKECPLRCPGCYAYEDEHLGGGVTLRQLSDSRGDQLVKGVIDVVDHYRPLHLSLVGGDPLVRCRELEILLPQLNARGIFVQVVTSAFRPIPQAWASLSRLNVVVSIDGLEPEHNERRKPATYERILKNIVGHRVVIHTTITGQTMRREGYWEEFLKFWTPRQEIKKVWFSLFTPQRGAPEAPEWLSPEERERVIADLYRLREQFPKLDMAKALIKEFARPPQSPDECIFAKTTLTLSADLRTKVEPCQFGGDPDCSRCGCVASMGLAAVGNHVIVPGLTAGMIFHASARVGKMIAKLRAPVPPAPSGEPKSAASAARAVKLRDGRQEESLLL
ncbi:MAG TPA: radical SAM protein [Candidatus Acidoferrales bacterium]|nr:radical SAM protein [Candidatus Acidoferrales bacterium]